MTTTAQGTSYALDEEDDDTDYYSREPRLARQHLRSLSPERRAELAAEWDEIGGVR